MKEEKKKIVLTEDDRDALIEAFNEHARRDGYGPYLHWTDIARTGETVCIVEIPDFCEYAVYREDDFDLLFEQAYARDVMSLDEWKNHVKDEFEEAGVDAGLVSRYEKYLKMLEKEVIEDEML